MPNPFIDSTDLSNYLGRDVTADDGALIALDAACDIVRNITEQTFNAGTATVRLDGSGTDCVLLPERPVTNAGTVTVGGTLEPDFEFTAEGLLLRGTAGRLPRPCWPRGRLNVGVTYEFGYQPIDVPRDVRMVALMVASRLVVQGVAVSEQIGDVRMDYAGAALDLTENEQRILYSYKYIRS